ncbi:integrase core domain-containing protein, partial [Chromobacterium piscinae]
SMDWRLEPADLAALDTSLSAYCDRTQKTPSGDHEFDQLCTALGIEHRLTKPRHPQTNGMVERFNGRIADVLTTNRFDSSLDLAQTIERYLWLYNHQIPQKALNHESPVQTLKRWQSTQPELFVKRVTNRPGLNSYQAAETAFALTL